jgi:hypothetical protein
VPTRIAEAVWGFFSVYVVVFCVLMAMMMFIGLDQVTAFSPWRRPSITSARPGRGQLDLRHGPGRRQVGRRNRDDPRAAGDLHPAGAAHAGVLEALMRAALEKLLAGGRDDALLRFSLGSACLKDARCSEAAAMHLQQALEHDAGYSAAWKLLGQALLAAAGRNDEAATAWQRGIDTAECTRVTCRPRRRCACS